MNLPRIAWMSPLTELNCNVALQLVFKAHRLHAGDGFHHRRFAVRHMTDGANVDGRLPRDHLRGEGVSLPISCNEAKLTELLHNLEPARMWRYHP